MSRAGDARRTGIEGVSQLLGVAASLDELAEDLLTRSHLPGGRIEAHELGMNQHSSASAGGVAVGLCGTAGISDRILSPLVRTVSELIDRDGFLRGHDTDGSRIPQSWGMAQVLLGLSYRLDLVDPSQRERLRRLAENTVAMQDRTGGWPLRAGGPPELLFTFYPVAALTRSVRLGLVGEGMAVRALTAADNYLSAEMRLGRGSLEEQLLSLSALVRVRVALSLPQHDLKEMTRQVEDSALAGRRLALRDRSIVVYPQPAWHAVVWRPLLYLTLRADMSPLHPLKAQLGADLLRSFDRQLLAWPGPQAGVRLRTGVSWASALALRATYRLAGDIDDYGLTPEVWSQRCADLQEQEYDFDVVVSFAGADRQIASELCERLTRAGYLAFYDRDRQHALLGEDLAQYLQNTYFSRSRFAVVLISEHFLASRWAGNWEWRAVLARMQRQEEAYLLPYMLDDTVVPGLNPTIGYVSSKEFSPAQFADLVIRKLRSDRRA